MTIPIVTNYKAPHGKYVIRDRAFDQFIADVRSENVGETLAVLYTDDREKAMRFRTIWDAKVFGDRWIGQKKYVTEQRHPRLVRKAKYLE